MALFSNISNFLNGPVGNNLANDPQDIKNTKKNLKRLGYLDDETENEFITRELEAGIKSFQKDNGLRIDGILMPRGETEREIEDQGGFVFNPHIQPSYPAERRPSLPNTIITKAAGQNDKQQEKETTRISQEQQTENSEPVMASYGVISQNEDATGKERRGDTPPTPKKKPKTATKPPQNKLDKKLLDLIGGLESSDNYNVIVGGEEKPLTNMTVKEVRQLQKDLNEQGSGSAVGRYQIIGDNMDYLVKRMKLNENAVFDENMQWQQSF